MSCNCNRTGDVEYVITLNQQGPQGLNGPVGQDGFSPTIDVYEDTENSYKLKITTTDGTITTPNLKSVPTDTSKYVTIDTTQTIGSSKTYIAEQYFEGGIETNLITLPNGGYISNALGQVDIQTLEGSGFTITSGLTTATLFAVNDTNAMLQKPLYIRDGSGEYVHLERNYGMLPSKAYVGNTLPNNRLLTPNLIQAGAGININVDTSSTTGGTLTISSLVGMCRAPLMLDGSILYLNIDNQTIQVNTEGQLVANLDKVGNELNSVAGRVTSLETEVNNLSGEVATNSADIAELKAGGGGGSGYTKLTATEYNNLATKDSNTLYVVVADDNSNFTMYYGEIPMYMPSGGGDNASQKTYVAKIATTVTAEPYTA